MIRFCWAEARSAAQKNRRRRPAAELVVLGCHCSRKRQSAALVNQYQRAKVLANCRLLEFTEKKLATPLPRSSAQIVMGHR